MTARAAYDLIILDFDGVLADSAPWFRTVLNDLARTHGFRQVNEAEIEELRGISNRELVKAMRVPFWKLPAIAKDLRARVAAHADRIPLFPDAAPFLARVRAADVEVAIVSSNAEPTIRRILGDAAAHIGRYACGASLFGKAALLRRVARSAGQGARVLCIGDETRDIEAARKAGLGCAAVTWGYANRAGLEAGKPDVIVDDFGELERVVLGE